MQTEYPYNQSAIPEFLRHHRDPSHSDHFPHRASFKHVRYKHSQRINISHLYPVGLISLEDFKPDRLSRVEIGGGSAPVKSFVLTPPLLPPTGVESRNLKSITSVIVVFTRQPINSKSYKTKGFYRFYRLRRRGFGDVRDPWVGSVKEEGGGLLYGMLWERIAENLS